MGETIDARINFLQRQLHAVTLSIQDAKARGDTDAIGRLATLYQKIRADVLALQAEAKANDDPSAFLKALDALGDEVAKTGQQLRDAGANIVSGIGSTLKYLPIILLVALVVVGLLFAGKIRKDMK